MINLRSLKSIGEKSADDSLQFVVNYILNKIQRDKSEFSRYNYEEDWIEFDRYIGKLEEENRKKDFLNLRKVIIDNSEGEYLSNDTSFEKTLLRHLSST